MCHFSYRTFSSNLFNIFKLVFRLETLFLQVQQYCTDIYNTVARAWYTPPSSSSIPKIVSAMSSLLNLERERSKYGPGVHKGLAAICELIPSSFISEEKNKGDENIGGGGEV